jgi:LDH2 family malate/lactate/ureidoglycolate dehydrogenase
LPGGRSGPDIVPLYQRLGEPQGVGHLFAALQIDAFEPAASFRARVDETIRRIRSLPPAAGAPRAFLPGELEDLRALEHARRGIPLPADAVAEITRTAALAGLAPPAAVEAPPVA